MTGISSGISVNGNKTLAASYLALSNFVSFSVSLVMSIILSRYLSTEEYGTFKQVLYVYGTLLVIFSLGLPKAYSFFLARIPVEEGWHIVKKLNRLLLLLASVFSVILFAGSDFIADMLDNRWLGVNLRLFAIVPMMLMPVLGVESVLTVYGKTRLVLVYVLASRTLTVCFTVLPVIVMGFGVRGAVTGFAASSVLICAIGLRLLSVQFRNIANRHANLSFKEILRFVMPVFYSGIYGFIIGSASQFFVSRYFGVEQFAVFANGYHELPFASMVIGATAGILLPEFSRMSKENADNAEFQRLWRNVVMKSAMIIYPMSMFFCVFAPEIISIMYGGRYGQSAIFFRILTVVNLTRIVPYGPLLFAVGKGSVFSNCHMVTAIMLVGLEFLCVKLFPSIEGIAIIASGCTVFCLVIMMKAIAGVLKMGLRELMPLASLCKILLVSSVCCIVAKIGVISISNGGDVADLLCGFILFVPVYISVSSWAGLNYMDIFRDFIFVKKFRVLYGFFSSNKIS